MSHTGARRASSIVRAGLVVGAAAVLACSAGAGPATADWSIDTRTTFEAPSGRRVQRAGRLVFDRTHLRMVFAAGPDLEAGHVAVVLFDAGAGTVRAVDDARRSYVQLDRAEIEALARRVAETRREMEAVLPDLPPEEREAVRQMIRDMSPAEGGAEPQERVVPRDETQSIEGHTATLHDLVIGERLVGEVWVAPLQPFGLAPEDLAVFDAFSRFQGELIEHLGVAAAHTFGDAPLALFERVDGMPLLVRRIGAGRVESETRFGPIRRVEPEAGRYRVPGDYVRTVGPGGAPAPGSSSSSAPPSAPGSLEPTE